ncbi:DUF1828 domain-containing protein [Pseudomonas sp. CFBP 8758]|uniref:DUF1828 domain-containing protein n=1 Tax=Pseudomonas sp. CFBP 8758 TaxID=2775286 RepID=UPI001781BD51|nr:DUF1828 domain-containing protein [Pseudomonas sp. CFBP 8758]MBD8592330.1 DUF1828 domain-containing protein [Pseudomonas sp. CFBP 8758]
MSDAFGLACTHINSGLVYLESPISLSFDGTLIGAYVQDLGQGRVRITDNADTLFHAMTMGVSPNANKAAKLSSIAAECHISLSESGELHASCNESDVPYYMARFIEAASQISQACDAWRPAPISKFEKIVSKALRSGFPKRVKRDYEIQGASGHDLKFQFALDVESGNPQIIQTVSAQDDRPHWLSVYSTLGKMVDLKNAVPQARRLVILESANPADLSKAASALAESATVLVFQTPHQLIEDIRGMAA